MTRTVIAVDIGGTFTDLVALDTDTGEMVTVKEPSVPADFAAGVIGALRKAEVGPIAEFRHGTTVGTNAIIERNGARTGLLTTKGFRDVLLAARANKPDLYDSDWDPPEALVPRERIYTVGERVDYAGDVIERLDEEEVERIAAKMREDEVESVAICFLNAFANGDHERRAREILEAAGFASFICTSSEVLPEIREFERTSTTVANAYLGPTVSSYLKELESETRGREAGKLSGEFLVSHSGGGLMTAASASELPARICQSGPAAGVMGARVIAGRLGRDHAISLDMGGTSADVAAIIDGAVPLRSKWNVEFNIPIIFPAIDLVTIGAGGGTIAWIDEVGTLRSGPASAGSNPGPVCYGRGGEDPTNTDANLVLGRLQADSFNGGRLSLDIDASRRAIEERIAGPLGMSVEEAAVGMLRLANVAMLNAVRLMTTQRGFDPRDFSLIAFGGAGALHAAELAQDAQIREVIVPRLPGLMSARGILHIDIRHDLLEPLFVRASNLDEEKVRKALDRSLAVCEEIKSRDSGRESWEIVHSVDLRYFGQISSYLTKEVPSGEIIAQMRKMMAEFSDLHEREFGYRLPDDLGDVEVVNLRTTLIGVTDDFAEPAFEMKEAQGPSRSAEVYFPELRGFVDTPLIERDTLAPGSETEGPAIVTEWDSTTVVAPGNTLRVADGGDLLIQIGNEGEARR